MQRLSINSQSMYELIVHPHLSDLQSSITDPGVLGDFTIMDQVSSKRKIIDILGGGNILKRRDASCSIAFTPVSNLKYRTIETDEIYGATINCENEFYRGCLEDFRSKSPVFRAYVLKWFLSLVGKDLSSNAYFGDITRANDATGIWNWNTFDGVFKWIGRYIADSTIPAAQTQALATGALTAQNCVDTLKWAEAAQDPMMRTLPNLSKAFYVTQSVASGYQDYLIALGQNPPSVMMNGIPVLAYKGIPVLVQPTWGPVATAINGGTAVNLCVLTIIGNFVYGTDRTYGEGPQLNEALRVWYSDDDLAWKYAAFLKAGTQVALPEQVIIAAPTIAYS
jgi:hypothetical protein